MAVSATDISLLFVGFLVVMVLLEIRKLSRKQEPVSRLEEHFDRLSRQVRRIRPVDPHHPDAVQEPENVERLVAEMRQLRGELASARELLEASAHDGGQSSEALRAAGSALQRVDAHLEKVLVPESPAGERG